MGNLARRHVGRQARIMSIALVRARPRQSWVRSARHVALAARLQPHRTLAEGARSASTTAEKAKPAAAAAAAAPNSLMHWPKIYLELGKFRLSGLVVATTGSGYWMGCSTFDPEIFACTIAGTTLAALSANTFNQWLEAANDAKMGRTMKRPLPSGRISSNHALTVACTQAFAGPALLTCAVNPVAGGIAASTIALYAGCYTPLKQKHYLNTWVGAVVGGLPPLIGYAAATGGALDMQSALLAGILYSWQFPHFMALAHYCKKDYLAGGYVMLKDKAAAAVALRHNVSLIGLSLALPVTGLTSWEFGAESLLINSYFAYHGWKFYQHPNIPNARQLFRTSLWQLPLLLLLAGVHKQELDPDRRQVDIWEQCRQNLSVIIPNNCTARAIQEITEGPAKA